jgi:nicotinate-nucleotide adenylyltransferase
MESILDSKTQEEMCLDIGSHFPFMPLSNSNEEHGYIKDSVTFFGGSFQPFHQGHRACLDLCPEKNIVLILDRNPQKEARDFLPYDEYLKIFRELKDTHYFIYPAFWGSRQQNPTCAWLPMVKIAEKNLLIGDDSFMNFLTWQSPEKILMALSKLYVVPRNFSLDERELQKMKLLKINPSLEIIFLEDHPFKEISSTKLR